jgi:hypothetical protein
MNSTLRSTTLRNSRPFSITPEKCNRQAAIRVHKWQTALRVFRRQFDPLTIGFLVGGVAFAMGGCTLGVYMTDHHPIGVNISMLRWSIFLGIIGASALVSASYLVYGTPMLLPLRPARTQTCHTARSKRPLKSLYPDPNSFEAKRFRPARSAKNPSEIIIVPWRWSLNPSLP